MGSRTLRPQDTSAPRHFGTNFKPNHRWSRVMSELSWVQSVRTFHRSDAEVSRTTFFGTEVSWGSAEVSHVGPKCLVAEVSGNPVMWPFDSPYAISYRCSVGTESISSHFRDTWRQHMLLNEHTHQQTRQIAIPAGGGYNDKHHANTDHTARLSVKPWVCPTHLCTTLWFNVTR